MAINVSELISDPDFCTTFIVEKKSSGKWSKGQPVYELTRTTVTGIVAPSASEDLSLMPESDRKHGMKTFYTDTDMRLEVSDTEKTSDICIWNGKRYKLINGWNYSNNGYYKAMGELLGDDSE